ncbi:hypothetical protein [Salinispora cortesiana]|uniref:hypothetical protein n=1 Tax=Salinispora cortesiana TaxID=1305843 RepID=UPI0003F793C4|nr:hypothetical protein [Salinispora cortesiana]
MLEVSGDFEIHITAHAHHAEKLAVFAAERGVKFIHIVLDRGESQWIRRLALALDGAWV